MERGLKVDPCGVSVTYSQGNGVGSLKDGPVARSIPQVVFLLLIKVQCGVSTWTLQVTVRFECGLAKKIKAAQPTIGLDSFSGC